MSEWDEHMGGSQPASTKVLGIRSGETWQNSFSGDVYVVLGVNKTDCFVLDLERWEKYHCVVNIHWRKL